MAQIAISLLLLVAAGLFVRTLSNLQSIPLGFNRESVLLFEVNAPQAGYPESRVAAFYADLRRRLSEVPGVRDVTLSHASLIRAGRSHPITVNGAADAGHTDPVHGASILHDHADSDAAGAGDRGKRSPGNAARRRGERPVRPDQLRRRGPGGAAHRGRRQHEGRRRAPRLRNRRRRRDRPIRRAQGRDSAGRVHAVRAGPRSAAAGDDLRAAHRRRSAALRRRRPPDRARGRRPRAGDQSSRPRPPTSIRPSIRRSSSPDCAAPLRSSRW